MPEQKSNLPAKVGPNTEETLAALVTRYQANIIAALPAHVKPERVLSVIRTAITSNPGLRECSPMSVLAGIVAASRLGLELDPALGQAYLVPRWNKNTKRMEASFQIGYQGKLELIRRADPDVIVQTRHVRENDEFELVYDPKPVLMHRINARKARGKVIASYTYVQYPDGRVEIFEPMTVEQALAIRDRFAPRERCKDCWGRRPARENCAACKGTGQGEAFTGPWLTDEEEMIRKTCFHRDSKWLKKAVEMQDAVRIENRIDAGEAPETVVLDLPAEEGDNAGIAGATDAAKEDLKKRLAVRNQAIPHDEANGGAQGETGKPGTAAPGTDVKSPGPASTAAGGAQGETPAKSGRNDVKSPRAPNIVPKVDELPDPLDTRFERFDVLNCNDVLYRRNGDNTAWNRVELQGKAVAPGVELSGEEQAMGVLAAAARRSRARDPRPDAFDFGVPAGGDKR